MLLAMSVVTFRSTSRGQARLGVPLLRPLACTPPPDTQHVKLIGCSCQHAMIRMMRLPAIVHLLRSHCRVC